MKKRLGLAFLVCVPLLALGCTPQVGLVVLDTKPPQATVYLNDTRVGETPVTFKLDLRTPVTLKILKEGYLPKTEVLGVGWVERETRDGHYTEGDYVIQGITRGGFEIHTRRELREDPAVRKQRVWKEKEDSRARRKFKAWGDSMVGKDYHNVVNRLGPPGQTIDLPNGNKTMVFSPTPQGYEPKFETDTSGIVVGWTF